MSKLRVQEIAHTNGTIAATVNSNGVLYAPGHVIQVQNNYIIDPSSQSIVNNQASSSDPGQQITGMTLNFTPKFANSKILLQARWSGEFSNQTAAYNMMFFFERNGTPIGMPPQPGSLTIGNMPGFISYWTNDADSTMESCMWDCIDFPNTTNTITYAAAVQTNTPCTMYNNRCVNAATTGGYERGTSMITVWEIAQ